MNELQQLINRRLDELELSYRAAAARSGGDVSAATLNVIATGRHQGKLTRKVQRGIAAAIDVPLTKVEAAANTGGEVTEFRLPKRAENLTPKDRRAVMALVNALLEKQQGH